MKYPVIILLALIFLKYRVKAADSMDNLPESIVYVTDPDNSDCDSDGESSNVQTGQTGNSDKFLSLKDVGTGFSDPDSRPRLLKEASVMTVNMED